MPVSKDGNAEVQILYVTDGMANTSTDMRSACGRQASVHEQGWPR